MSQEALDYVMESEVVRALPGSEKFLLRTIALLHKLEVNCAWAKVGYLAEQTMTSDRQCRRLLASLEGKGLLLRHKSVRGNGSQMTNEYELPGMKVSMAVGAQARQQVFKGSRTRVAAQLCLLSDGRGIKAGPSTGREDAAAGILPVENIGGVSAHPRTSVVRPPPDIMVSALEVSFEEKNEEVIPLVLLKPVVGGKAGSSGQEQKQANASATANAKTEPREAAMVSTESVGATSTSSRGRRVRFPGRELLDGVDAALYDEATRVLVACSISPSDSTRRLRRAIVEQLRLRVDQAECCVADAGSLAVARWKLYRDSSHLLRFTVGMRRFFLEAEWLDVTTWPWDRRALEGRSLAVGKDGPRKLVRY